MLLISMPSEGAQAVLAHPRLLGRAVSLLPPPAFPRVMQIAAEAYLGSGSVRNAALPPWVL